MRRRRGIGMRNPRMSMNRGWLEVYERTREDDD